MKYWIIFFVTLTLVGCGSGGSSTPPATSSNFSSSSIASVASSSTIGTSSVDASSNASLATSSASSVPDAGMLLLDVAPIVDPLFAGQPLALDASASRFELNADAEINYSWELIEAPDYLREQSDTLDFKVLCLGDNYAQRIRGYLYVPEDDHYTFAVSSNDQHQFWLGNSGEVQSAIPLTSSYSPNDRLQFHLQSQQQSAPNFLQAGKPYYFELLHLQRDGDAHLNIAWKTSGSEFTLVDSAHFSSLEDGALTGPTGRVTREIFFNLVEESIFNFLAARDIYRGSKIKLESKNVSKLTFTPPVHGNYLVKMTGRGAGTEASITIPFSVEPAPLPDKSFPSDSPSWRVVAQQETRDMFKHKAQCGSDESGCLAIETPAGVYHAGEWRRRIHVKPQTAYLLTAKVRAANLQYRTSSVADRYRGPYIGIGQFWSARAGISDSLDTDWKEIKIDFATTPTGVVDIYISMGEAAGDFYVQSIKLEPLEEEVTRFESQHMILNVYNDIVALAGGQNAVQDHVDRVSGVISTMAEFSGNYERLQCDKESAWMPKHWDIGALGLSGNPMLYARPLEENLTRLVWPRSSAVDAIFTHELNHNFDFDPLSFGRHMNSILETHALKTMNLGRSEISANQWYKQERDMFDKNFAEGCISPDALTSKLLQFSEIHGWGPLKQVMHGARTDPKPWPTSRYEQYLRWWEELQIETGVDGWQTLHTLAEQAEIASMFQRRLPFPLENPATLSDAERQLLLSHAEFSEPESVGWDRLWRNSIAGCRLRTKNANFSSGILAHAPSRVIFNIDGKWKSFTTSLGIALGHDTGSVVAIVKGDGRELLRALVDYHTVKNISVDVEGVKSLELIYEANGSASNDWSIWLEPKITR